MQPKPQNPRVTASGKSTALGKRSRIQPCSLSCLVEDRFPTFFILHSNESPLSKLSPFFIEKALSGITSGIKSVKTLRSGDLLVETISATSSRSLSESKKLGHVNITVSPHKTLNTSRGVISEDSLLDLSEEEILEGFSPRGVVQVKRILIKKDGKQIPTKHLILTFNSPTLPESIQAGYLKCKVRPYIPNPLRCFKCQKYGHGSATCRGKPTCAKCGLSSHINTECSGPIICLNCGGGHPAYSRSCPRWKEEKDIQAVMVKQSLSYFDARRQVSPFHQAKTYASVVSTKKSVSTIGTQTTITCPPSNSFTISLAEIVKTPKSIMQSVSTETTISVPSSSNVSVPKSSTTIPDTGAKPKIKPKPSKLNPKINRSPKVKLKRLEKASLQVDPDSEVEKMNVDPVPPKPPDVEDEGLPDELVLF